MRADIVTVEVLQTLVSAEVEQYHDRHHLRIRQSRLTVILPFPPVTFRRQPVYLDEFLIYFAEIVRHTEYFRNFVLGDHHSDCFCCFVLFAYSNIQKLSLFY